MISTVECYWLRGLGRLRRLERLGRLGRLIGSDSVPD